MVARQHCDERLAGDYFVGHLRPRLDAEEAEVDLAILQRVGEVGRVQAHDLELDAGQLRPQHAGDVGQPIDLLPGEEADGEARLGRPRRLPRRPYRLRRLVDRAAGVIEEGVARRGQLDASRDAGEQGSADLVLQVAQLPAERGLSGVQPLLGRYGDAALLGHGDEIAEVAQLHRGPMLGKYAAKPYKVFFRRSSKA